MTRTIIVVLALAACGDQAPSATTTALPPMDTHLVPPSAIGPAQTSTFVPPAAPPTFDPGPPAEPFNPNGVNGNRPTRPVPGL